VGLDDCFMLEVNGLEDVKGRERGWSVIWIAKGWDMVCRRFIGCQPQMVLGMVFGLGERLTIPRTFFRSSQSYENYFWPKKVSTNVMTLSILIFYNFKGTVSFATFVFSSIETI
jgi:hypothetical protein